uniref:Uncharacterized protein n=1 Tax=viral metagenome TaxID=1070528 RepID=A0A6C0CX71_9ZZZZ
MAKFFAQKCQGFEKMDKNKCPIFKTPYILATTCFQNVFYSIKLSKPVFRILRESIIL